jgi:CHAT domain-containing protein
VPDGPLYRIPFAALRLNDGAYAVDRYAISSVPSATVVADLWLHPASVRERPARVLAFGDAIVAAGVGGALERGSNDPGESERSATTGGSSLLEVLSEGAPAVSSLPRLQWSGDEARMVAAFGRGSVLRLGHDATPRALEAAPLDSFSVIHFATHAVVDEQMPARSALLLSGDESSTGLVDAGFLEGRHLSATLVVLSACRTARGTLVEGEGLRGLANPFLAAGAHAVLATQWAIGDRSAVPLVYAIYRGIATGLPAAEALRRAEAAAYHRGAPVREWAAFTLVGDPLARVALETPPPDAIPTWVREAATASALRSR